MYWDTLSPMEGFPENRIVKHLLDLEVNMINFDFSRFNELFRDYYSEYIFRDLNSNLKEIETIRKDPENCICEYFGQLTRQVDLRRETLIEDIHKYSDKLIQKIENLKQDCVAKSKEAMVTSENILTKRKSKELGDLMEPVLKQYKLELQGQKYYKLVIDEIKIENIFGILSCFVNDIDNMPVNIV